MNLFLFLKIKVCTNKKSDKNFLQSYFDKSRSSAENHYIRNYRHETDAYIYNDQGLLSALDIELFVPPQTGTETRKSRPTGTKLRATSSDKEAFYLRMREDATPIFAHYSACQLRNRGVILCRCGTPHRLILQKNRYLHLGRCGV